MKCAIKDCENQVSLLCLSCHALISGEGLPSQAYHNSRRMIETALIKQPEQEPVAWLSIDCIGERYLCFSKPTDNDQVQPLYTAPPKREWVGYTNEDRKRIVPVLVQSLLNHDDKTMAVLLKAILIDIEQQLKEKNCG